MHREWWIRFDKGLSGFFSSSFNSSCIFSSSTCTCFFLILFISFFSFFSSQSFLTSLLPTLYLITSYILLLLLLLVFILIYINIFLSLLYHSCNSASREFILTQNDYLIRWENWWNSESVFLLNKQRDFQSSEIRLEAKRKFFLFHSQDKLSKSSTFKL